WGRSRPSEPRARPQSRVLGECARGDLLSALGPDTCHLNLAATGGDRQACVIDGHHLARLAVCRPAELLRVEELYDRSLVGRPGARLRIRTADQIPDGVDRLVPVDLDVLLLAPALVRRLGLVLNDFRRLAVADQIDGLDQ